MKLFKTIPIYLILYENKIKVFRLDSGKFIERITDVPFSNSRILWANFQRGEEFVNTITNDLIAGDRTIIKPFFSMLIHQVELNEGGLSEVEKRAIIDSARHMRANEIFLIEDKNELSIKEASERLEELKK